MKKIASLFAGLALGVAFVSCAQQQTKPSKCSPCSPNKKCGPADECAQNETQN